jgi:hypothetical protein
VEVMNGCSENDITAYENWDDLSSDDMDSGIYRWAVLLHLLLLLFVDLFFLLDDDDDDDDVYLNKLQTKGVKKSILYM